MKAGIARTLEVLIAFASGRTLPLIIGAALFSLSCWGDAVTVQVTWRGVAGTINESRPPRLLETPQGRKFLPLNWKVQPDGGILLSGWLERLGSEERDFELFRIYSDGRLDHAFAPEVRCGRLFDVQRDGRILVGANGGEIVRLLPNGAIDPSFSTDLSGLNPGAGSEILLQQNGQLILFEAWSWDSANLIRLNQDGSADPVFHVVVGGAGPFELQCALDARGRLLARGGFSQVNHVPSENLIRLRPDGSIDNDFQPPPEIRLGRVVNGAIAVRQDGRVLTSIVGSERDAGAILLLEENGKLVAKTELKPYDVPRFHGELPDGSFLGSVFQIDRSRLFRILADGLLLPLVRNRQTLHEWVLRLPDGTMVVPQTTGVESPVFSMQAFRELELRDQPLRFSRLYQTKGMGMQLVLDGFLGDRSYELESSSDLRHWTPLLGDRLNWHDAIANSGSLQLYEPGEWKAHQQHYYRVRESEFE